MKRLVQSAAIPLLLLVCLFGLACASKSSKQSSVDAGAAQHEAPEAREAPEAPEARELPRPVLLDDVQVEEGSTANLGFTLAFRVRRDPDDAGKTFQQAAALCRERGRMLCTETQWIRACEQHSVVGQMESWTVTRRSKGVVVAGGRGCSSRERELEGSVHPNRVGICCERAVTLRAGDAGPWLGPGNRLPLRLERALNEGDDKKMRALLADTVVRDGKKWSADALIGQERAARSSVGWTLFDSCDIRVGPVVVGKSDAGPERQQGTLLSCRTVLDRKDDVVSYITMFGLVGSDEDSYRIAQIDHRGSVLIPGLR